MSDREREGKGDGEEGSVKRETDRHRQTDRERPKESPPPLVMVISLDFPTTNFSSIEQPFSRSQLYNSSKELVFSHSESIFCEKIKLKKKLSKMN